MKKIYVAFDGDKDIYHFNLLKAWKGNPHIELDFHNSHDLNKTYDDSQNESIRAQLRKRFDESNVFLILIGESTKNLRKFIPWEIEQAINRNLPIVVVNLNNKHGRDYNLTPTDILNYNRTVDFVPFRLEHIQNALAKT